MKNEVKNILAEASGVLDKMENGKTYPSGYVIQRFEKAAQKYPTDHLIGNMRDVIVKVAQKQEFITQRDIKGLYDRMYGFSGGQTGFRNVLSDMLPEDRQFQKVAYNGSSRRTNEEKPVAPLYKDSELSNAFSVLFTLGNNASFSTFKPTHDKTLEKVVISKLSSLGHVPEGVDIIHSNDHYALCSANYKTSKFNKISALIPVQITNGITKDPEHVILGGVAVNLDSANLYTAIKEAEKDTNGKAYKKFANQRENTDFDDLSVPKAVVPNSLKEFTNLENTLVAAASNFGHNEIKMAIASIDTELRSFGIKSKEIKVESSDKSGLLFGVTIPTKLGDTKIKVPVEIQEGMVTLPSRFAAASGSKDESVYDFSKKGFERFASTLKPNSQNFKFARDTGPLSEMSYHQLMDRMIDGVANKDYRASEDALSVIEKRFGGNQYLVAFDKFTQLLKYSASSTKRDQLIKEAFDRGDLIKVPTSVDLYCPKLGLPVSKISFDNKGRPVPAGRRDKLENQSQEAIIASRIVLT